MTKKPQKPQPRTPEEAQVRDQCYTPHYATRLLKPFLPDNLSYLWEPAAGAGYMAKSLRAIGYIVFESSLETGYNFLEKEFPQLFGEIAIVTNPPYSIKDLFLYRCLELGIPFALLIPCGWPRYMQDAIRAGCHLIAIERRVDYIMPNICWTVYKRETLRIANSLYGDREEPFKKLEELPEGLEIEINAPQYKNPHEIPQRLITKYSSSNFDSQWLVKGFKTTQQITIAELSIADKQLVFA